MGVMVDRGEIEKFVAYWLAQACSERSQCHQFWDSLLGEVLGVTDLKRFIEYEKPVYLNDGVNCPFLFFACQWLSKA